MKFEKIERLVNRSQISCPEIKFEKNVLSETIFERKNMKNW